MKEELVKLWTDYLRHLNEERKLFKGHGVFHEQPSLHSFMRYLINRKEK